MITFWLLLFWAMQLAATVFFKYGADVPGRFWYGFVYGNLFGASSIFVLMKIYQAMQINVAMSLAGGGTFLLIQVLMALAYREHLNWLQWTGISLVVLGMVLVTANKSPAQDSIGKQAQANTLHTHQILALGHEPH